jgi:2-polyprenyl-6-methoxyphenol hydroxylase-like FAD-dependent oxidoreductase
VVWSTGHAGPVRVVVVGAGLAGLALATGLARDAHEVVLLEADSALTARPQGYRIHLDSRGLDPLRSLLPARSMALVEATVGTFLDPRGLEVLSPRLRHLKTVATGPGEVDGRLVSTAVDRGTLRAILASAAIEAGVEIRWGATVLATSSDDEAAWVTIAQGESAQGESRQGESIRADLVVACDGARSSLEAAGPGRPVVNDSGAGSIVGRAPAAAVSPRLLELLAHGYVVLRGLRTAAGFGLLRFANPPDAAGRAAGVPLPAVEDYLSWNVGLPDRRPIATATPAELLDHAVRRLRAAHRDVRAAVAATDPGQVFLAPAQQAQRPAAWAPGRVTTLGDAAHVMPPDRGSGANLALADAARLATALTALDGRDATALLRAVGAAEREMVEQAFAVSEAGPTSDRTPQRSSRAASGSG